MVEKPQVDWGNLEDGTEGPIELVRFETETCPVALVMRHVPRSVQTACDPGLARLEPLFGLDLGEDPDPIWSWGHMGLHLYPSALQMGNFLLSNPARELLRGRRVLELGCGPGLLGLILPLAGATSVVLTDFDPLVLDLCLHNQS